MLCLGKWRYSRCLAKPVGLIVVILLVGTFFEDHLLYTSAMPFGALQNLASGGDFPFVGYYHSAQQYHNNSDHSAASYYIQNPLFWSASIMDDDATVATADASQVMIVDYEMIEHANTRQEVHKDEKKQVKPSITQHKQVPTGQEQPDARQFHQKQTQEPKQEQQQEHKREEKRKKFEEKKRAKYKAKIEKYKDDPKKRQIYEKLLERLDQQAKQQDAKDDAKHKTAADGNGEQPFYRGCQFDFSHHFKSSPETFLEIFTRDNSRTNKRESNCPVKKAAKKTVAAAVEAAAIAKRVLHKVWPGFLDPPVKAEASASAQDS